MLMWPFSLIASRNAQKLKDRIEDLEDRTRALESSHKALEVEWESLYDNVRRALAKMAKRAQRIDQDDAATSAANGSETTGPAPTGVHQLSDQMSARIRASRRAP